MLNTVRKAAVHTVVSKGVHDNIFTKFPFNRRVLVIKKRLITLLVD